MFKSPGSLLSLAFGGALQPRRKVKRDSLRVLDPNDPHQAARIAAAAKRARKGAARAMNAYRSARNNKAHCEGAVNRLNPFYINRSITA